MFETELTRVLEAHDLDILCLAGHASADRGVRHALAGADAEHPSLALARNTAACTRMPARSRQAMRGGVHRARGDGGAGWRPDSRRGAGAVFAGDTPDRLGARVLEQEHRLYPMVLRRFAEGDRRRIDL